MQNTSFTGLFSLTGLIIGQVYASFDYTVSAFMSIIDVQVNATTFFDQNFYDVGVFASLGASVTI